MYITHELMHSILYKSKILQLICVLNVEVNNNMYDTY